MRLLKFEASWCQPCKALTKVMDEMTFPFYVEKLDIDTDNTAAMEYGIRGVPTLILLDENNNIVKRLNGFQTKQQLTEAFNL